MTAVIQHQQSETRYGDTTLRQTVAMQQPETAKNVTVYVNGDKYLPGRRFVVNRKHVQDFNGFLNLVTNGLKPAFGAVRNIYTPNQGHRVTGLEDINSGMAMVAGGSERFRKLKYQDITGPSRRPAVKPRQENLVIRPAHHNTKMNAVAARWKEITRGPCNIFVYVNGDINGAAVRLLLIPRLLKKWDMVLQEVTEKLASRIGQACRKLFTLHGELVTGSDQLENGRYYVAVGNEKFKRLPYGERAQRMALMTTSKRTHIQLPPIRRKLPTNAAKPGDPTYSQKYAARKQLEEERSQQSRPPIVSKPPTSKRIPPSRRTGPSAPPPATNESESVFHAKPVKVKRSGASGKLTQVAADNEDDVFRAKQNRIRAEEVADDEDTKVDLPIDQVPADTVEDEDISVKHTEDEKQQRPQPSPEVKQTYAPRIEEDDSDLTISSKTPTSARVDEPQPSARSKENVAQPNGHAIPSPEQTLTPTKLSNDLRNETKNRDEAAVVIQSSYRGYRARKILKSRRDDTNSENVSEDRAVMHEPLPAITSPSAEFVEDVSAVYSGAQGQRDTPHQDLKKIEVSSEHENVTLTPNENSRQASQESGAVLDDDQSSKPQYSLEEAAFTQPEVTESTENFETDFGIVPKNAEPSPLNSPLENVQGSQSPSGDVTSSANEPTPQEEPIERNENSFGEDFSSPKDEEQPMTKLSSEDPADLPERDDGDGTENEQPPDDERELNGSVAAKEQEPKSSQQPSRSDTATPAEDNQSHTPKNHLEETQIPNGQPSVIEGGI